MECFGKWVLAAAFVQEIEADILIDNLKDIFNVTKVMFNGECSTKKSIV